jgi:hypothetical protein
MDRWQAAAVASTVVLVVGAGGAQAQSGPGAVPLVEKPVAGRPAPPPAPSGPSIRPVPGFVPSPGGPPPHVGRRPEFGGAAYVPPPAVPIHVPPPRPYPVHSPSVGIVIGAPRPYWPRPYYGPRWGHPPVWGWPAYPPYPPAVVVSPPVVIAQPPPVYVERPAEPTAPAAGFWYWCSDPQGFYPDVGECPAGWQPVAPREQ